MTHKAPRVVLVTRPTELEGLVSRHGTLGQARFFLSRRGQDLEVVRERHERQGAAVSRARAAIPRSWRSVRLSRADLSRFVFEPEDLIVAVGQDGLVANVAKYLTTQRVIGLNPDPERYPGVLVPHAPEDLESLLRRASLDEVEVQPRTMVEAETDDGQRLRALNEIYVGQRTHQSSRYVLCLGDAEERHSSSGLLVCTGTGATGWARSIANERGTRFALPTPTAPALAFFVREAWPSVATGTELTAGLLAPGDSLEVRSEMNEGGVLFGDGIEEDRLELGFGRAVTLRRSDECLRMVV